jgi:LysM repeat protein
LGISDRALLDVLAWVAWVAWFNILLSTLGNIVALVRGSESPRIPIAGAFQPLTASLLGAVILALLAFGRTPPATSSSARSALSVQIGSTRGVLTADSDIAQPVSTSGTSITSAPDASIPVVYTVVPEDSLWRIAQMKLGDALEWPEIFALNEGRIQSDGRALSDPSVIYPGWELVLPPAPSTRTVTTTPSGSPTPSAPAPSVPIPITTPTTVSPTTVRSDQSTATATSVPDAASSPIRPVGGAASDVGDTLISLRGRAVRG